MPIDHGFFVKVDVR